MALGSRGRKGRGGKQAGRAAPPPRLHRGGAACLVVAALLALLLALDHLGGLSLPGCGETGACAEATRGPWGKVPGTAWPVSFLGLAYFAALLAAWPTLRRGVPATLVHVVRLGALASVGFVGVLVALGHACPYCLGVHAANLGLWIVVERSVRPGVDAVRPLAIAAAVFLGVTAALAPIERQATERVREGLQRDVDASVARILETSPGAPAAAAAPSGRTTAANERPKAAVATESRAEGFTGRWRKGPVEAPIRIVIISDYQCSDCQAVEAVAREIVLRRPDVSLSAKHFPMDMKCNPNVSRTPHPNACWAARAAEAAGILGGNEGFWRFHEWLFARSGSFTRTELPPALQEQGYDPDEFIRVMSGPETLKSVQEDIAEAMGLGLHFTPMIFVNGVQLRGVFAQNASALAAAVERIAAEAPPAATAAADRPPSAPEKAVEDWRAERAVLLPPDSRPWVLGRDDARVRIVLWGDYQDAAQLPLADGAIRDWIAGRHDARYAFRHFPLDQSCNPSAPVTARPQACRASRAAEAAGLLGGAGAYWRMHAWLLSHQADLSDAALVGAALEAGVDQAALLAMLEEPAVTEGIEEDARAAVPSPGRPPSFLYRDALPTIYVNEKVVPQWQVGGKPVIDRILDAAASE